MMQAALAAICLAASPFLEAAAPLLSRLVWAQPGPALPQDVPAGVLTADLEAGGKLTIGIIDQLARYVLSAAAMPCGLHRLVSPNMCQGPDDWPHPCVHVQEQRNAHSTG